MSKYYEAKLVVGGPNSDMTAEALAQALRTAITNIFPDSLVQVKFATNISPAISIVFAFTQKGRWPRGIIENDRAFHRIFVGNGEIQRDGTVPFKVRAELLTGGKIFGPNVTNMVKVGWRNRSGTPEQIIGHIKAYFTKLDIAIQDHPDADKWRDSSQEDSREDLQQLHDEAAALRRVLGEGEKPT